MYMYVSTVYIIYKRAKKVLRESNMSTQEAPTQYEDEPTQYEDEPTQYEDEPTQYEDEPTQSFNSRLREKGANLKPQIPRNPVCHAPECVNRHLTKLGIHLFTKASCDICERDLDETPTPPMVYEHDERAKSFEDVEEEGVDIKKKYPTVFFVKKDRTGMLRRSEYTGPRDSDVMFEAYRESEIH